MIFITSEMHYRSKRLVAEIMDVSTQQTSLGRLVTARAVSSGKALLSGPADTGSLKALIQEMKRFDVDTTIVDRGTLPPQSQLSGCDGSHGVSHGSRGIL